MRFAWFGALPTNDNDANAYEMGTRFQVNRPMLLVGVRIHSTGGISRASRAAKLWSTDSSYANLGQVASATLPDTMPAGWSYWYFDTPVLVATAPGYYLISYDLGTGADHNVIGAAFASAITTPDAAITMPVGAGRYNATPDTFPTSLFNNEWYGVDPLYEVAPTVPLSVVFFPPSTAASTSANAECATGTGTAYNAAATVQPNAGAITGTGTAYVASTKVSPGQNVATGTGAAGTAAASLKPSAGSGAGTGTAGAAGITESTGSGGSVGTGTAGAPAPSIAVSAGLAQGAGTASGAMGNDQGSALPATGTGTAYNAGVSVAGTAGTATGSGTAGALSQITAGAGLASGTGTAYNTTTTEVTTTATTVGGGISGRRGSYIQPVTIDVARDDEEVLLLIG